MPAGTYGRNTMGTTGFPLSVHASDPADLDYKLGGVTIDWGLVTAVSADTTLPDGNVVLNGRKYLRFGQILARANVAEVQTVEFTGGPTTGSAIITAPDLGDIPGGNFTVPATSTAAAFEALLLAVYNGDPVAGVSRAGAGSAGSPYVYTVTFNRKYGNVAAFANVSNTFGGGTTPSVTLATGTAGSGTGLWGPYDSGAADGTQTLTRGECFILDETVLEVPALGWGAPQTTVLGQVFDGGLVVKDRLLITAGTASKANGPTVAAFETAFPRIEYAIA